MMRVATLTENAMPDTLPARCAQRPSPGSAWRAPILGGMLAAACALPAQATLPQPIFSASAEAKVIVEYVDTVGNFNSARFATDLQQGSASTAGDAANATARAGGSGTWTYGGSVPNGTVSSGSGTSNANASASIGRLRGSVSGTGTATVDAGGSANGQAHANASFVDYLQFSAPGGGAIELRFGVGIEGQARATNGGASAGASASAAVWTPTSARMLWSDGVGFFNGSDAGPFSSSQAVSVRAGDIIELGGGLALSGSFAPTGGFSADASNTAEVYFEILTPGATYVSASGVQYRSAPSWATAVPEPHSAVLLLAGLAALGGQVAIRRRRR